jgi:mono/diheme cytochrome c family protein
MKIRPLLLAAGSAALALMVAGCITARHTEPIAPPLQFSDAKLNRGQRVFYQECHLCHPHGGAGLGPAIVNKPLPKFLMKIQVRHGLGAMPSFKADKISSEDLEALVSFIKEVHANKPAPENVRPTR